MRFSHVLLAISISAAALLVLGYAATRHSAPAMETPAAFAH